MNSKSPNNCLLFGDLEFIVPHLELATIGHNEAITSSN